MTLDNQFSQFLTLTDLQRNVL